MKRFFTLFILLNAVLSILAVCPDRPTIPTSSITNGFLITPKSEGMSNFPTSTTKLTVTMAIIPNQACAAGSTYKLFAMGLTPPGSSTQEYFTVSIDCDTLKLTWGGDWYSLSQTGAFPSGFGPIALVMLFDLEKGSVTYGYQSESKTLSVLQKFMTISGGMSFDKNTKFYLCSDKLGTSPNACTISEFILEYRGYGTGGVEYAHQGGKFPSHAAFYPLTDGPATSLKSYTSSETQAASGYFGDHPTNPTSGTSPTWDSSNAFVTITKGQFLTFPLPSIIPGPATTSYSFSIAAWVRIRDISMTANTFSTLFSMHLADGTSSGYLLRVVGGPQALSLTFVSPLFSTGTFPSISLDTWQLIGFTAMIRTDMKYTDCSVFSGTSSIASYQAVASASPFDLSTISFIRIGGATGSFGGDVSLVRIMTPGGGVLRYTDLCSSLSNFELGAADFAGSCSGSNKLNSLDGKCYESCPSGTRPATTEAASLCLPCLFPCLTCDSTQCKTCVADYYLYKGVCLGSCPEKTYNTGSKCEDCSTGCSDCNSSKCLTCDPEYLFYKGDCFDSCPDKTYLTGSVCKDCSTNCKECDSFKCLTCDEDYVLYQGDCLGSCPENTYSTDSTCENCSTNCKKCSDKECLACDTSYILEEGSCRNPCPEKTYYTGSKCQNFPARCQTCDKTGCLACETNYFSYEENCIESCPAKTYVYETSCLDCSDDHCIKCNNDKCTACDDEYELDSHKKCVLSSSSPTIPPTTPPTTPPTNPPSSHQSSSTSQVQAGLSGGAVAGIVLGGIVTTTIAGGAIYILKFKPIRRSRILPQKTKEDFNLINSSPNSPTTAIPPVQTCETEGPMLTEV